MRTRPGTAIKQLWLAIVRLHESAHNGRECVLLQEAGAESSGSVWYLESCVNNSDGVALAHSSTLGSAMVHQREQPVVGHRSLVGPKRGMDSRR